jgi:hypothetical protein
MQVKTLHLLAEARLHDMLSGMLLARMIAMVAQYGIADMLADGPKHHEHLSSELGLSSSALCRVMRALSSHGVFEESSEAPGVFQHTEVSELLQDGTASSMRSFAMLHGSDWLWRSVGHMPHSASTGGPAFHDLFGSGTFQYFERNPEHGQLFFSAMNQVTEQLLPALLSACDFSRFHYMMDVGGGLGALAAAILKRYPDMRGAIFDLPFMQQPATDYIATQQLSQRCDVVSGDFFESIPEGADLHIMKWIIHDWSDEQSVKILRNCREAIAPGGRVMLVEQVVSEGNVPCPGKMMDIMMLLMEQGRERTEAEFASLFEAAGFRLSQRTPLMGAWSVLEAEPV